jgi:hypothetical protein
MVIADSLNAVSATGVLYPTSWALMPGQQKKTKAIKK